MNILYDISSKTNSVVVGTSNKSEIMLGYGTIYGDTACAFNPIGEIFKSDLFEFASYLGICKDIIEKKPSADLWSGQSDEDELGYSYKTLDEVLKVISKNVDISKDELSKQFDEKLANSVLKRFNNNKFKTQIPPIAKI